MDKLELIRELCKEKGITVNALENALDLPTGTINKMGKSKPNADRLHLIAEYFDLPMEVFYASNIDIEKLQTLRRIKHYIQASHEVFDSDEEFKAFSDELEEFEKSLKKEPVYDVAAGQGRINDGYTDKFLEEEDMEGYGWCQVCGDSMSPKLLDGDYVRIEYTTETEPSDLTAIRIDGEACTIKNVEVCENGIWVRAINKDVYEDRFFTMKEVLSLPISIIGKAVELKRSL